MVNIQEVPSGGWYVEEVSAEEGMKKSAVVARALELAREGREEDLLREGYQGMAEHDLELRCTKSSSTSR
jgi:hypothetical protein